MGEVALACTSPTLHPPFPPTVHQTSTERVNIKTFRAIAIEFHLMATHALHFYYCPTPAEEHVQQAEKFTGLNVQLTGAMGKRTRFQQKEVSQLVLQVQREGAGAEEVQEQEQLSAVDKKELPHVSGSPQPLLTKRSHFNIHQCLGMVWKTSGAGGGGGGSRVQFSQPNSVILFILVQVLRPNVLRLVSYQYQGTCMGP